MVHIQEEFWDSQKEKQINIISLTYFFLYKVFFQGLIFTTELTVKVFRKETRIRQVICTLVETWDAKKSSSSLFWVDAGGIPHPSVHSWN